MGWFLYDRNLRHERVKYRIFRPFHVNGLFCCANQMTSFYIMGLWGEHYVVRRKQNVRMTTNLMELATLIYTTFKLLRN